MQGDDQPEPSPGPAASFAELVAQRVADAARLAAVRQTGLLDTPAEAAFDRIASIASRLLDTPFGFVTIVDDARSYWKACIGVDADAPADRQNAVHESFCQYVIGTGDAFMIDDTRVDPRTGDNPSIESMGVLAWAGVPLRSRDGEILGTVCVVDQRTRSWTDDDARLLFDLAALATDAVEITAVAGRAARTEALLAEILARAPIGFALVDDDLRYERINQTLAEINGVAADEHLGRSIDEVLPDVAAQVSPILRGVLDSGEPVVGLEVTGTTPASPGEERTWSANYYRLDVDDDRHAGLFVEEITEQAQARRRARILARIAESLSTTETVDELNAVITHDVRTYFGAATAIVEFVDDGTTIDRRPGDRIASTTATTGPPDSSPRSAALRTGTVVTISDAADRRARFDEDAPTELTAEATVPCVTGDGRTVGVLTIGWDHRVRPDDFPMPQLSTVARLITGVIERSETDRERQRMLQSLHSTLLAPPPVRRGLRTAVRYRPANHAIGFGGDWYDVVAIDDVRTALVVGDVEGHGPVAAARMSQLSSIVTQLLLADEPLEELFVDVERICRARSIEVMSTVGIVVVDVAERSITPISAGHLPGLIVPPDGSARLLRPALRPPLSGWGTAIRPEAQRFRPGTRLVLFTDGLVETRGGDISGDLDQLVDVVSRLGRVSIDELADELVAEYARRAEADDVAMIVAELD